MNTISRRAIYLVLLAVLACSGDSSGPRTGPPAAIVVTSGRDQTGTVGRTLTDPLTVRIADAQGTPVAGVAVTFTVLAGQGGLSATAAQTGADGTASTTWTLGRDLGEQRVQVSVAKPDGGTLTTTFTATANAGPAVSITRVGGDGQLGGTRGSLRDSVVVRLVDEFGNAVSGATVNWSAQAGGTVSPATSVTNVAGQASTSWTLGDALGPVTLNATSGSLPSTTFTATAVFSITGISPAIITPGATITLTGVNFTAGAASNTVLIAGTDATVQTASATSITALVPATLPCMPAGDVTVSLTTGGVTGSRRHPARTAPQRNITVGQVLLGSPADPLGCLELPQDGGRYLIAVTNTNPDASTAASVRLRSTSDVATLATVSAPAASVDRVAADPTGALARRARHLRLVEANRQDMEATRQSGGLRMQAVGQQVVPNVNDTMSIRVPRLTSGSVSCSAFDEIRARVVAVGTRGIVLEDITNTLAGQMDSYYRQLSDIFDASQYDIVKNNFGDPLLLDAQLDNNGRVMMVFSNKVNTTGAAGFVVNFDFRPRAECAGSNFAEIFYGYVPTVNSTSFGQNTIGEWWWYVRSTIIHEVKHIASFALARSTGRPSEDTWLEEAMAMLSEELGARTTFGYAKGGNTGYLQSISCELDGAFGGTAACVDKPATMFIHFAYLADWMEAPSTESMLCPRWDDPSCVPSIYGSGWSFMRWLLDQSTQPEDVLLRALHQVTQRGVQNIEGRFGRPFSELFTEWTLALALDDRPGFSPGTTPFSIPSWNTRNVFAGLNAELAQLFPTAFPLQSRGFSYGNTEFNVQAIRGGAAAFFELSGTPVGRQVLEFTAAEGQPLSSTARIAIVRIQ